MSHGTTYTTSLKNVASIKSLTKKAYEKYSSNKFSDDNLTSDRNETFFFKFKFYLYHLYELDV